jgi:hypothetical protein
VPPRIEERDKDMKQRKGLPVEKKPRRKYAERGVSFYPLKPEEILSAFMKVDPQKIAKVKDKPKKKGAKK